MDRIFINNLYQSYWEELCTKLRNRFGNGPPDPEDIAQQAFLRFAEVYVDNPIQNPRAFIYTIARNLVIDAKRIRSKQEQIIDEIFEDLQITPLNEVSPEWIAVQEERMSVIQRAIVQLSKKQQEILLANRLNGETYQSIAKRTGYSISDISRSLNKANITIQEAIDEWEHASSAVSVNQLLGEKSL